MCMVCLLHLFATSARHSQCRMKQPLHKKIEIQSNFWDSRWSVSNFVIARLRKLPQRNLVRRDWHFVARVRKWKPEKHSQ